MNPLDHVLIESHKNTMKMLEDTLAALEEINDALKSINSNFSVPSPYVKQ